MAKRWLCAFNSIINLYVASSRHSVVYYSKLTETETRYTRYFLVLIFFISVSSKSKCKKSIFRELFCLVKIRLKDLVCFCIHAFFYKQRYFSFEARCCLIFWDFRLTCCLLSCCLFKSNQYLYFLAFYFYFYFFETVQTSTSVWYEKIASILLENSETIITQEDIFFFYKFTKKKDN